ncbi:hypothetical protein, partial [Acanthopleuribacter pedis]
RPNGEEASIRQIYREDSNFRAWLQIKPLAHFPIVLVLNLTALGIHAQAPLRCIVEGVFVTPPPV